MSHKFDPPFWRRVAGVVSFALFSSAVPALASDKAERREYICRSEPSVAERLICNDRQLTRLDAELNEVYAVAWEGTSGQLRRDLRDKQRAWLRRRNACGNVYSCIERMYERRIQMLGDPASAIGATAVSDQGDDQSNNRSQCAGEGQYRSLAGVEATRLTFRNRAESEEDSYKIYWLDYSGKRVLYKHLYKGQTFEVKTFLSHPWIVTAPIPGGGEDCIQTNWPTRNGRVITLH